MQIHEYLKYCFFFYVCLRHLNRIAAILMLNVFYFFYFYVLLNAQGFIYLEGRSQLCPRLSQACRDPTIMYSFNLHLTPQRCSMSQIRLARRC